MAEIIKSIKDFVASVGQKAVDLIGLKLDAFWVGVMVFVTALVVLVIIIIAITCSIKSKKKKKQSLEKAKAKQENIKQTAEKQITTTHTKEQAVAEQAVAEIKEEEPEEIKEETGDKEEQPVEEAPAPVPAKKTAPAKKVTAKKPAVKKTLAGKWIIEIKSAGEYMSKLLASNGEVMLSSEIYSSEEGAKQGIATIIKWVEEGTFVIYQDKKKNYYYKLKTAGNRLICVGEIYKSEEQCKSAVESVKRIAKGATVVSELVEGARYVDYVPQPFDEEIKGLKGKWKVEALGDGKFSARLYASNGQLMISTEEVASKKTALNAIESVRKNSIVGNFIVDKDKFGRFYYKLRNAQKSVICIGEAYDSLDACTKALESVRRFAVNSNIMPE